MTLLLGDLSLAEVVSNGIRGDYAKFVLCLFGGSRNCGDMGSKTRPGDVALLYKVCVEDSQGLMSDTDGMHRSQILVGSSVLSIACLATLMLLHVLCLCHMACHVFVIMSSIMQYLGSPSARWLELMYASCELPWTPHTFTYDCRRRKKI